MDKKKLTLDDYQVKAMSTRMATCNNYTYMAEGLVAEVGELMGKVAKGCRSGQVSVVTNHLAFDGVGLYQGATKFPDTEIFKQSLMYELGDCLWFIAGLADYFGYTLNDVAEMNLTKLADRAKRGKIEGEGDER